MRVQHSEGSGDEPLAAGFAAHERWAFSEAYRRNAPLLYSAAYNVLGNDDEAKDCVADTIARLWRARQPYSPGRGSLRNFLLVCVRNDAISRRRRHVRRARMESRLAELASPHDAFEGGDPIERDRVRNALLALPQDQRIAIALAFYGEKTHTEIAAELHEPLGTIKSRIKLGLRKLAAALAPSAEAKDER